MKTTSEFMKKGILTFFFSCLISLSMFSQGQSNFSGMWGYNESKSALGEGGFRMVSQTITITQNDQTFKIERNIRDQDGEDMKMSETYTLDGKESVNPIFNTSKKSKVVWSADKKVLTVSSVMLFDMNGEQGEIKTTEIYKLGEGGKLLSIETQSASSMGERKYTLAYDKK